MDEIKKLALKETTNKNIKPLMGNGNEEQERGSEDSRGATVISDISIQQLKFSRAPNALAWD